MANEKTLKTRIKLRYDTFANWTAKDPTLLEGEIAVVAIPTDSSVEQVQGTTPPQILFKIGAKKSDGSLYKFSELSWASGMAADVYKWAKQANPSEAIALNVEGNGNAITSLKWNEDTQTIIGVTDTQFATSAELDLKANLDQVNKLATTLATKADKTEAIGTVTQTGVHSNQIKVAAVSGTSKNETITINNVEEAGTAKNVSQQINGHDIASIFEKNGTTVKTATKALSDSQGNDIVSFYATKDYVDQHVAAAVQYLGVISSKADLPAYDSTENKKIGKGDFWRVGSSMSLDPQAPVDYELVWNYIVNDSDFDEWALTIKKYGTAKMSSIRLEDVHNRVIANKKIIGGDFFLMMDTGMEPYHPVYVFDNGGEVRGDDFPTNREVIAVTVKAPGGYPFSTNELHANDLLVAAISNPKNEYGAWGYYVVHGEETSLAGITAGTGIDITNKDSATPTIGVDFNVVAKKEDIKPGTITNVAAGNGLTGGGENGKVTIHVGPGNGINVSRDAISVQDYNTILTSKSATVNSNNIGILEDMNANMIILDGGNANAALEPRTQIDFTWSHNTPVPAYQIKATPDNVNKIILTSSKGLTESYTLPEPALQNIENDEYTITVFFKDGSRSASQLHLEGKTTMVIIY